MSTSNHTLCLMEWLPFSVLAGAAVWTDAGHYMNTARGHGHMVRGSNGRNGWRARYVRWAQGVDPGSACTAQPRTPKPAVGTRRCRRCKLGALFAAWLRRERSLGTARRNGS
jgi:hypothetical protein